MKLQHKLHRSTESDNNLIPMINVVFLLLIFFMITGIVRVSDPLPLTAPESTGDNPTIAQTVLYVAVDGTLILDETPVSMANLDTTLAKLDAMPVADKPDTDIASQELENVIIRMPQNKPLLAIKADARVTVSLLKDIMHAVRKAGLTHVELITLWAPAVAR